MNEHTVAIVVIAGRNRTDPPFELVLLGELDDYGDAQDWVIKLARLHCDKVDFADDAVHSGTLVGHDFEVCAKVVEVEHAEVPLEVVRVVPFDHGVFNHADAAQVAMDLHDFVRVQVMPIFVVIQDCLSRGLRQLGNEPFDARYVQKALHAEEIYSDLYHITFAHLSDGLDQWTLLDLLQWVLSLLVGSVGLVERRLLLGLVPMYPH